MAPDAKKKPDFELAVDPAKLMLVQGQSVSTTISITRVGGFDEDVALEVVGLPAGVTAAFDPESASGTSSELTLSATLDAAVGTVTLTVRGTAGDVMREATLTLEVQPEAVADVTVRVVDFFGNPVPGHVVALDVTDPQMTDSEGRVTLTEVTRPYTLFVQGAPNLVIYHGLTRTDPTVLALNETGEGSTALLNGSITGVPDPLPAGLQTSTTAVGPELHVSPQANSPVAYTLSLIWPHTGNVNATPTASWPSPAGAGGAGTQISAIQLSNVPASETGVAVTLPELPTPIPPANGATDVPTNAVLTWTAPQDTISGVIVNHPALGDVFVLTAEPQLDIGTLPAPGGPLTWPAGTTITYQPLFSGPFASLDEAAGAGPRVIEGLLAAAGFRRPGAFFFATDVVSFTTAAAP